MAVDEAQAEVLVIVPTMGAPNLILPSVARICQNAINATMRLMVVANAPWEARETLQMVASQCAAMVEQHNSVRENPILLHWMQMPGPAGWVGAVNYAVSAAVEMGLPEHIIIMNDDVLVTPRWIEKLRAAVSTDRVHLRIEMVTHGEAYMQGDGHDAQDYGRIGMIGPVSANVAGSQHLAPPTAKVSASALFECAPEDELNSFAALNEQQNDGVVLSADFLSGFCTLYTRDCLQALLDDAGNLLNPAYRVGGFDDNDVSVRAAQCGFRLAVAVDTYVHHMGHKTLDMVYPEQQRGLKNASVYLRQWKDYTQRDQRLVAVYRVGLDVPWDLQILRTSLERTAGLVDGIAILVTKNPNEIHKSSEFKLGSFGPDEAELIAATGAEYPDKQAALEKWAGKVFAGSSVDFAVLYRDPEGHEWNERDERNAAIELAEQRLNPDWLISVDHDEVFEDRITRQYMKRLMRHPNPLVMAYDIGFITHWDTPRLHRTDPPYAHKYKQNMRGYRMWRVNKNAQLRIQTGTEKGLHCGNVPPFSEQAQRISGLRMRHFGYMRQQDRWRKFRRYKSWMDPDPNARLTGGGYAHIVQEEAMELNLYSAKNGIVFTMMMHAGERAYDLYRHLDTIYALVDHIVLVWTDEAEPSEDVSAIAELFGAHWVQQRFDGNASLAACRNAGLDYIQEHCAVGVRWVLTLDPDEHFSRSQKDLIALRRMGEVTDSLGWMFQFKNYRADGTFNISETVRMFLLDDQGIMRYSGRVHERLERAMRKISENGIHPQVRYAPFMMDHFGLGKSDQQMQKKLDRYTELLAAAIMDDPADCGHWVSLGLQYANDGEYTKQNKCFEIARECAGTAYLPWKVSAQQSLRDARAHLERCVHSLIEGHPYRKEAERMLQWLQKAAPPMPVSGLARVGQAKPPEIDFDQLVARYEDHVGG